MINTQTNKYEITEDQLAFAVFCIENIAEYLNTDGKTVYDLLTIQSKILDDYILPCADVLHTQGKSYIVNDIVECMKLKGVIK